MSNPPTSSELRRSYLLAGKTKKELIEIIICLERNLQVCKDQNSSLREKILSNLALDFVI